MKILFKSILIVSLSTLTTIAFADGCQSTGYQKGDQFFGKTQCENVVMSQLTVHGQSNLNKVEVNGDTSVNGIVNGHDLTVKGSLTISGKTTLNTVKVTGATSIQGQTTLSNANLQNLKVQGKLNISGSQLAETMVSGGVYLRDVVIKGTLTASTDVAVLNGVEVNSIEITKSLSNKSPIICLEKASHVQGDIHFDGGNGTVYTMGASKIMGKVIGGNVIEGSCPNEAKVNIQ